MTPKVFKSRYNYNPKEHFYYAFGVINTTDQQPESASLRCSREQGEYISSYPIHHSQKVIQETDDFIIFEFRLYLTYDFIQTILSYGKEVTVLYPQHLIERIKDILSCTLNNYNVESLK